MNTEPVAWAMFVDGDFMDAIHPNEHDRVEGKYTVPLYTHPAKTEDAVSIQQALEYEKVFEEGRQLGMLQERALWNLTESTQEIENTHPAKTLTDEEIIQTAINWAKENHADIFTEPTEDEEKMLCSLIRAILRKAQEK